jgi:hypothetical protein
MPTTTSALASLVPLVGAVALTIQGTRRLLSKPRDTGPAPAAAPQPVQIAPPPKAAARRPRERPDGICPECGTSIPPSERICAACERRGGAPGSWRALLLNWLAFAAMTGAIFGVGWLVSH